MEYNGTGYTPKQRKGVGGAVLIACTAIAVVIGLFAGVLMMNGAIRF